MRFYRKTLRNANVIEQRAEEEAKALLPPETDGAFSAHFQYYGVIKVCEEYTQMRQVYEALKGITACRGGGC